MVDSLKKMAEKSLKWLLKEQSIKDILDNFQLVEPDTLKSKEASMNYECKITVLETKGFSELQEKYLADPK